MMMMVTRVRSRTGSVKTCTLISTWLLHLLWMMTAVIWCVFNLSWLRYVRRYAFSDTLLVTFLFNVYKCFLLFCSLFYVFDVFKFFLNVLLHLWSWGLMTEKFYHYVLKRLNSSTWPADSFTLFVGRKTTLEQFRGFRGCF